MSLNIALDGPAGAGKSTIAKMLAARLDILYLDTGALYRAVAYGVIEGGVNPDNPAAVEKALPSLNIEVQYKNGAQITLLNNKRLGNEIRTPRISEYASKLSALPCVRADLLETQRRIAKAMDCVLDGRDIGTMVLPDCPHKFFVTASLEVRARRRWLEFDKKDDYQTVLEEIKQRDQRDANREHAPLRQAEDAVLIDTTDMTPQEAVGEILRRLP
ncbi:MAG: (d)CMP kinase [Clostridia bacterium]|nr:(d)CMP kinase [Clostridia bacterium]